VADPTDANAAALPIIRAMFAFTVIGSAAAAITLHRDQPVGAALIYAPTLLAVVNLGLALFFRDRGGTAGAQARTNAIIAWALGESAAIFGWIAHYIGAPLVWALPGTVAFVLILSLVPVPPADS
jgi:hypothetical protein